MKKMYENKEDSHDIKFAVSGEGGDEQTLRSDLSLGQKLRPPSLATNCRRTSWQSPRRWFLTPRSASQQRFGICKTSW